MELPKLLIKWREREVSPWEDVLVRWLFLLEGSEDEEILKTLEEIAVQDSVLNKAIEEWEKYSDDPKVREEWRFFMFSISWCQARMSGCPGEKTNFGLRGFKAGICWYFPKFVELLQGVGSPFYVIMV